MTGRTVLIAVALAISSGLIYGYNIGVYSGAIIGIRDDLGLDDRQIGNLIAAFELMEIVSVLLAALADRYGRRRTMLSAAALMTVAPLLPLFGTSHETLLLARALSGLAAGYIFVVALVFVAEVCRPRVAPPMASLLAASISAGYLAELLADAQLVPNHHWRIAIALGAVPALVQLAGLFFLRESPAYHRLRGDEVRAAMASRFYGLEDRGPDPGPASPQVLARLIQGLRTDHLRRQLGRGLIVIMSGAIGGHVMVTHYGPLALEYFGESDPGRALEILSLFSLLGFFCSILALVPIARGHSVRLLWGSLATMGVVQLALGFASGPTAVALLGLLLLTFSFGLRTTLFQIVARLFSDAHRTIGVASLNLVFNALGAISEDLLPALFDDWGQSVFLGFGAFALLFAFLCWFTLADGKALQSS